MAKKEDIRDRVRKVNPRALEIFDELDRQLLKRGGGSGVIVTTTEDMGPEEQEMALFEGFLKEGYTEEVAAQKAREFLLLIEQSFEEMRRMRRNKKNGR
jgi:hypothetical protein